MTTAYASKAAGWVGFAGVMLILAGALDVVDGLRAIGAQDTRFDAIFWDDNIEAWGWFYVVVGIVLIAAGFGVFQRASWAVWVGITVAMLGAMANMLWVFVYPIHSLILVAINTLVIYALIVYTPSDTA